MQPSSDPTTLQVIGIVVAMLGVVVTSTVLVLQLRLSRRQLRIASEQKAVAERQAEIGHRQSRLDVLEHARDLWRGLDEEGRVGRLFVQFPRTDPRTPWDDGLMLAPAVEQDRWSLAQRTIALDRLLATRETDAQLHALVADARALVGGLNELGELLDWDLIELLPVIEPSRIHSGFAVHRPAAAQACWTWVICAGVGVRPAVG